ncbi:hypothetical protein ACNKHX_09665 [Shigella flexneri]
MNCCDEIKPLKRCSVFMVASPKPIASIVVVEVKSSTYALRLSPVARRHQHPQAADHPEMSQLKTTRN